jgi:hypothetical protein
MTCTNRIFTRVGARPWLERTEAFLSGQVAPIFAPQSVPEEAPIA